MPCPRIWVVLPNSTPAPLHAIYGAAVTSEPCVMGGMAMFAAVSIYSI